MTERGRVWYYKHGMDHGEFTCSIPNRITAADCDDLEAHFQLVIKQCRRRAIKVES